MVRRLRVNFQWGVWVNQTVSPEYGWELAGSVDASKIEAVLFRLFRACYVCINRVAYNRDRMIVSERQREG